MFLPTKGEETNAAAEARRVPGARPRDVGRRRVAEAARAGVRVTHRSAARRQILGEREVQVRGPGVVAPEGGGDDVRWNFEKFVVGRDGQVQERFASGTEPDSSALGAAIEQALGQPG